MNKNNNFKEMDEEKHEMKKIIDEMTIKAQGNFHGFYEGLNKGLIDRQQYRAILRQRVIEAIEFQFKEGLEFTDLGATLHVENMIYLISDFNENGEKSLP